MPTPTTTTTDIAARLACRKPGWAEQSLTVSGSRTAAPANTGEGAAIGESPTTLLAIGLRRTPHHRTVVFAVTSQDLSASWEVEVNGVQVTVSSGAYSDIPTLHAAITSAITSGLSSVVNAANLDDVDGNRVEITGVSSEDYAISISSDGSDVFIVVAEYASGVVVPAFTLDADTGFTAPSGWFTDPAHVYVARGVEGTHVRRLNTGGYLRGFVRLEQLAGVPGDNALTTTYYTPTAHWGPAQSED